MYSYLGPGYPQIGPKVPHKLFIMDFNQNLLERSGSCSTNWIMFRFDLFWEKIFPFGGGKIIAHILSGVHLGIQRNHHWNWASPWVGRRKFGFRGSEKRRRTRNDENDWGREAAEQQQRTSTVKREFGPSADSKAKGERRCNFATLI